jgi:hypothetical protein
MVFIQQNPILSQDKCLVVPTKQCRSIISISYILWFLAARGEKSGVYKARQGGISKPELLCRDYLFPRACSSDKDHPETRHLLFVTKNGKSPGNILRKSSNLLPP